MKTFNVLLRCASPFVFVGMSLYGLGCTIDPDQIGGDSEEAVLDRTQMGYGGDPGTINHLRPEVLHDHGVQQTVRDLGNVELVDTDGYLPEMPFLPSSNAIGELEGARVEFLETLIGCALPEGTFVTDPAHLVRSPENPRLATYKRYHGQIGLAPAWRTRGLTTSEKQWLTACVLERTNRFGETVRIMLEGAHEAITFGEEAKSMFPALESRAWGNMFDSKRELSTTNPAVDPRSIAFDAYICHETSSCSTGIPGLLRQCDAEDACGFQYVGACSEFFAGCAAFGRNVAHAGCATRDHAIRARLEEKEMFCEMPQEVQGGQP